MASPGAWKTHQTGLAAQAARDASPVMRAGLAGNGWWEATCGGAVSGVAFFMRDDRVASKNARSDVSMRA